MIACVSPSQVYADETMNTLNYATRTMNIKNRPVIQMDPKEQIIFNLKREIALLRMENEYLKEKVYALNGGQPIDLPFSTMYSGRTNISLPPIKSMAGGGKQAASVSGSRPSSKQIEAAMYPMQNRGNIGGDHHKRLLEEYDFEMTRIKEENSQLRYQKELRERDYESVMFENNTLLYKLDNLENIFVGTPISKKDKGDMHLEPEIHLEEYSQSKLALENNELHKKIAELEEEKFKLKQMIYENQSYTPSAGGHNGSMVDTDVIQLREINAHLQRRIEGMMKREKQLLESLKAHQGRGNGPSVPMGQRKGSQGYNPPMQNGRGYANMHGNKPMKRDIEV